MQIRGISIYDTHAPVHAMPWTLHRANVHIEEYFHDHIVGEDVNRHEA